VLREEAAILLASPICITHRRSNNKELGAALNHVGCWYRIRDVCGGPCRLQGSLRVAMLDCNFQTMPKLTVTLRSSGPAIATCLDGQPATNRKAMTDGTYKDSSCAAYSLWLYADANQSGSMICFRGNGSVNLSDYTYNCQVGFCYSWNDVASSYYTGCSGGSFYEDANLSGTRQDFGMYAPGNFDRQSGRLPNDSLSSLSLNSNC